jgi:hypothetical protein
MEGEMYSSHEEGRKTDYLEELLRFMSGYLPQLGTPTSITMGTAEGAAFMRVEYGGMPQQSYQKTAGPMLQGSRTGGYTPMPQLAGKYNQGSMRYLGLPPADHSRPGYNNGSYFDAKPGAYKGGKAGDNAGSKGGSAAGGAGSGSSAGAGSSGGGK